MVDRVMTQVDRITENLDQMPVAAFIFRDKVDDEVNYAFEERLDTPLKFEGRVWETCFCQAQGHVQRQTLEMTLR